MGVEATFVEPDCSEEDLNAAFRDNTKVVFGESIANPALVVLDFEKFAKAAHAHGVPSVSYTHLDVYKRQAVRSPTIIFRRVDLPAPLIPTRAAFSWSSI